MTDSFSLDLPLAHAGKVRRLYELPDADDAAAGRDRGRYLMVATDAISAYDHVLSSPVPDKGVVLTQMSLWWFDQLDEPNHVISTDVPAAVQGRAIVAEKLDMIPVECVARGYLTGSGWAEYSAFGTVCGIPLPEGLEDGSRLPEPLFTPAVKAAAGEHDENVSFERIVELHGQELAETLRARTLHLYRQAEEIARKRGLILADTKVEYGRRSDGTLVLADEVLTPDSSRFWDAATWAPGSRLESFDKQFVRDWLAHESGWDRGGGTPPPALPGVVVEATRLRYMEAFERLTGHPLDLPAVAGEDLPFDLGSTPRADLIVGGAFSADDVAEQSAGSDSMPAMARVVVDVMPKPEILDPQGKAVTGALHRLGFTGLTVRQGKRFEVTVEGEVTDDTLAEVRDAAEKLLANTVIEAYDVRVERR